MGRLIVSTHVTLDGVIDSIGAWFNTHGEHSWDAAAGRAAFDQLRAADAILLGRLSTALDYLQWSWSPLLRAGLVIASLRIIRAGRETRSRHRWVGIGRGQSRSG
jgi:hypothetical protein